MSTGFYIEFQINHAVFHHRKREQAPGFRYKVMPVCIPSVRSPDFDIADALHSFKMQHDPRIRAVVIRNQDSGCFSIRSGSCKNTVASAAPLRRLRRMFRAK